MPAGKILLYAEIGGKAAQKITLPLTIKTETDDKVTIRMSQKSITLNSNKVVGSEQIKVKLLSSAIGYDYTGASITVTDTKGKGDYSDMLDISVYENEYTFTTRGTTEDCTYRVNVSIPGIPKPATVDVVVKAIVPALKADKKSVNIDEFGDYKDSVRQEVTLTLSDSTISRTLGDFDSRVYDSKGKLADSELDVWFTGYATDPIVAKIDANSSTKYGKYTVELFYTMPGSSVESVAKVTVKVNGKLPSIKTSTSTVTLNRSLGKNDISTVPFKVKNGVIKLSAPQPNKVILNKNDKYDSKIVKVKLTDADALSLDIKEVKMKAGSPYDATLIYVGGDYAYVAIGWKDDTVSADVKAGKQTLEFYTGYNFGGRNVPNGTVTVN